jgi:hypothetical protein
MRQNNFRKERRMQNLKKKTQILFAPSSFNSTASFLSAFYQLFDPKSKDLHRIDQSEGQNICHPTDED